MTYSFGLERMELTKGTRRHSALDCEPVITHLIRIVDCEDEFVEPAILEFQCEAQRDAVFAALAMSGLENNHG